MWRCCCPGTLLLWPLGDGRLECWAPVILLQQPLPALIQALVFISSQKGHISCGSLSVSSFSWLYSIAVATSTAFQICHSTLDLIYPQPPFWASRVNRVLSHLFSVSIYTPPKILWLGKHGVSSLSFLQIKNSKAPISVFFLTLPLINCSILLSFAFKRFLKTVKYSQSISQFLLPLSAPSTSQKRILLPLTLLSHLQVTLQNLTTLTGLGGFHLHRK